MCEHYFNGGHLGAVMTAWVSRSREPGLEPARALRATAHLVAGGSLSLPACSGGIDLFLDMLGSTELCSTRCSIDGGVLEALLASTPTSTRQERAWQLQQDHPLGSYSRKVMGPCTLWVIDISNDLGIALEGGYR